MGYISDIACVCKSASDIRLIYSKRLTVLQHFDPMDKKRDDDKGKVI